MLCFEEVSEWCEIFSVRQVVKRIHSKGSFEEEVFDVYHLKSVKKSSRFSDPVSTLCYLPTFMRCLDGLEEDIKFSFWKMCLNG